MDNRLAHGRVAPRFALTIETFGQLPVCRPEDAFVFHESPAGNPPPERIPHALTTRNPLWFALVFPRPLVIAQVQRGHQAVRMTSPPRWTVNHSSYRMRSRRFIRNRYRPACSRHSIGA